MSLHYGYIRDEEFKNPDLTTHVLRKELPRIQPSDVRSFSELCHIFYHTLPRELRDEVYKYIFGRTSKKRCIQAQSSTALLIPHPTYASAEEPTTTSLVPWIWRLDMVGVGMIQEMTEVWYENTMLSFDSKYPNSFEKVMLGKGSLDIFFSPLKNLEAVEIRMNYKDYEIEFQSSTDAPFQAAFPERLKFLRQLDKKCRIVLDVKRSIDSYYSFEVSTTVWRSIRDTIELMVRQLKEDGYTVVASMGERLIFDNMTIFENLTSFYGVSSYYAALDSKHVQDLVYFSMEQNRNQQRPEWMTAHPWNIAMDFVIGIDVGGELKHIL